eukprot:jgi/Mesvir1/616/Mv02047-RA.2
MRLMGAPPSPPSNRSADRNDLLDRGVVMLAEAIADAPRMLGLQGLGLAGNCVGPEGARALASLIRTQGEQQARWCLQMQASSIQQQRSSLRQQASSGIPQKALSRQQRAQGLGEGPPVDVMQGSDHRQGLHRRLDKGGMAHPHPHPPPPQEPHQALQPITPATPTPIHLQLLSHPLARPLAYLDLSDNLLGDDGAEHLADALAGARGAALSYSGSFASPSPPGSLAADAWRQGLVMGARGARAFGRARERSNWDRVTAVMRASQGHSGALSRAHAVGPSDHGGYGYADTRGLVDGTVSSGGHGHAGGAGPAGNLVPVGGHGHVKHGMGTAVGMGMLGPTQAPGPVSGHASPAPGLVARSALAHLLLSGNNIGPRGAGALADALPHNTSLRSLALSRNPIRCDGAVALAEALFTNRALRRLSLSSCKVGSLGFSELVSALLMNRHLAELDLSGSRPGGKGVRALEAALVEQPAGSGPPPVSLQQGGFIQQPALAPQRGFMGLPPPAPNAVLTASQQMLEPSPRHSHMASPWASRAQELSLVSSRAASPRDQSVRGHGHDIYSGYHDHDVTHGGVAGEGRPLSQGMPVLLGRGDAAGPNSTGDYSTAGPYSTGDYSTAGYSRGGYSMGGYPAGNSVAGASPMVADGLTLARGAFGFHVGIEEGGLFGGDEYGGLNRGGEDDSSNGVAVGLRALSLEHCLISDDMARQLATALATNRALRHLSLAGNTIGAAGVEAIADMLAANASLVHLDLARNASFGDEGVLLLAKALVRNRTLRSLALAGNQVEGRGARALAAALERNGTLESLDIATPLQPEAAVGRRKAAILSKSLDRARGQHKGSVLELLGLNATSTLSLTGSPGKVLIGSSDLRSPPLRSNSGPYIGPSGNPAVGSAVGGHQGEGMVEGDWREVGPKPSVVDWVEDAYGSMGGWDVHPASFGGVTQSASSWVGPGGSNAGMEAGQGAKRSGGRKQEVKRRGIWAGDFDDLLEKGAAAWTDSTGGVEGDGSGWGSGSEGARPSDWKESLSRREVGKSWQW